MLKDFSLNVDNAIYRSSRFMHLNLL